MALVNKLYAFIEGSTKRHALFTNKQLANHNQSVVLKRSETTRWGSKKAAVHSLIKAQDAVLETLLDIQENDLQSTGKATTLLLGYEDFDFQFTLRVLHKVFEYTGILSDSLQSPELDVDYCRDLINSTLSAFKELRSEVEFEKIYDDSVQFATKNSLQQPYLPRPSRAAQHRSTTFETPRERYKSMLFEIIDSVTKEIEFRFENNACESILSMERIIKGNGSDDDINHLFNLNFYNRLVDFDKLQQELKTWNHFIDLKLRSQRAKKRVSVISKIFFEESCVISFPELEKLIRIYLTIPVTSVTAERTFSAMKRIKTHLRNTMGQERLSSLSLIQVEKELTKSIKLESVIDKFGSMSNRKMKFF
jgi:hypothetical protein